MCLNCYRDHKIGTITPLILFLKHENILIVLNIPLCDYRSKMLTDKTDMKHVKNRHGDTARDKVRAKSDENNFFP